MVNRGRPKEDHVANFWKYVEKHNECWHWIGARSANGYGAAWFEGTLWKAHRLSYFLNHGQIDEKRMVLHSCDKPWCVRPEHLRLGTALDNTRDAISRNRLYRPRPLGALINTDASDLPINPPMKRKKNLSSQSVTLVKGLRQ
jgi:hypothetical protein